jgi:hypothetical protein
VTTAAIEIRKAPARLTHRKTTTGRETLLKAAVSVLRMVGQREEWRNLPIEDLKLYLS